MLFHNIEMPLVEVLTDMEFTGVRVNKDYLEDMGKELQEKIVILKDLLEKKSITLAIGMEYTPLLSNTSVEQLMRTAEQRMYEDKSLYYKQKGLDRRNH